MHTLQTLLAYTKTYFLVPLYALLIKLENYLLEVEQPRPQNQQDQGHEQPFFDIFRYPQKLSSYLYQEMVISMMVSMSILTWFYLNIANQLSYLFSCDKVLFAWLSSITFLNITGVVTKAIVLCQIRKLKKHRRIPLLRKHVEALLRMRIYKFSSRISYALSFVYGAWLPKYLLFSQNECSKDYSSMEFNLVMFFSARIIFGFFHFQRLFYKTEFDGGLSIEDLEYIDTGRFEKIEKLGKEKMNRQMEKECSICLFEFSEKSKVSLLPCAFGHLFHKKCIEKWFKTHSNCPICQFDIREYINSA